MKPDAKRFLVVQLIADSPPPRPACFDLDSDWTQWLVAAHEAGLKVVRRSDTGRTRGKRETHFEVLPLDQIDICHDCTESRRARMAAVGRCTPPAAHALLAALKAGATRAALAKIIEARPVDADLLRAFFAVAQADMRRASAAAAAAVKNASARAHVRQAWTHHQDQVAHGRAEAMSKAAFAAVMVAAMARDPAWNDAAGRPFRIAPRRVAEHWLAPAASNVRTLPATSAHNQPAKPAQKGVTT